MYNLLGTLIENYWWGEGGGAPRTAAYFHSAKLCSSLYREVRHIRGLLYRDSTVCNFALLRGKGKGKGKQTPIEATVVTNVKNA